jgi:hypothetical protein
MGRFDCLQAVKKEKAQTTSGSNQNAADHNQFRRHEEFLSQNFPLVSQAVLPPVFLALPRVQPGANNCLPRRALSLPRGLHQLSRLFIIQTLLSNYPAIDAGHKLLIQPKPESVLLVVDAN